MNLIIDTSPQDKPAPPGHVNRTGSIQVAESQGAESQAVQPDRVTISEEALRKLGLLKDLPAGPAKGDVPVRSKPAAVSSSSGSTQDTLALANLQRIDRDVRAHEQAHIAVGGSLVQGGASFGYTTGPDGRLYAVSGEVSIDTSPVRDDPEATVQKMMRVVAAAEAPAQPSGQDRAVASAAMKVEMEAQGQIAQRRVEKLQGAGSGAQQDALQTRRVNLQA